MLDGVIVGNLLISLLKHADRVTSASTQPGVLLAIHNASLVGASPGTHRGHTVKSSNSKQGKTTTGLIPSDSQRGSPRTRWGRPSSTCSFKAAALARPSSMTNRHQRLRLQPLPPPCPRTPNTDRRWLSLAVNSEAGIRHWTALTIDHHLALDTLVMRRSGVRFPEAAPCLVSSSSSVAKQPTSAARSGMFTVAATSPNAHANQDQHKPQD